MKEHPIHHFEGTDLETTIDEIAGNSEWGDLIFINPYKDVIRVQADQDELFNRQNPDLTGWTRVIWGTELAE